MINVRDVPNKVISFLIYHCYIIYMFLIAAVEISGVAHIDSFVSLNHIYFITRRKRFAYATLSDGIIL